MTLENFGVKVCLSSMSFRSRNKALVRAVECCIKV